MGQVCEAGTFYGAVFLLDLYICSRAIGYIMQMARGRLISTRAISRGGCLSSTVVEARGLELLLVNGYDVVDACLPDTFLDKTSSSVVVFSLIAGAWLLTLCIITRISGRCSRNRIRMDFTGLFYQQVPSWRQVEQDDEHTVSRHSCGC
ncbi:hypothetical protein GGR56DRAFT_634451 [Xylariaceae sp. FL0804]|nr:hypothetical protein GGR56DRAFT_634451 [Xylariaceae sp. FL0804]